MTCPSCHKTAATIHTAIRGGQLITSCNNCSKRSQPNSLAARNRREQQKKDFRKDLLQPSQFREYARAYPEQSVDKYGEEAARRLS